MATKMSWAASRQTTRLEDQAYCLMGLFNVQMPLLYGEGIHAFRRLQEEILRKTNDSTIFAYRPSGKSTFLADSAQAFSWWTGVSLGSPSIYQSWTQTNIGIDWTACSTDFPLHDAYRWNDEKYLNILLCDKALTVTDVERLLGNGLPLYTASRTIKWLNKTRWLFRWKRTIGVNDNLELQGQCVFLTMDILGTRQKEAPDVHYGIGPSLLALPSFSEFVVWKNPKRIMLRTIEPGLHHAKQAQNDGK